VIGALSVAPSKLRKVGKRAFLYTRLAAITISASTQQIDGSAFIGVHSKQFESQHFIVEGDRLLTPNGTEMVRYFGRELKLIVPGQVEVLGESCLEKCLSSGKLCLRKHLSRGGSVNLRSRRAAH
jgi:hypothetical protein